MGNLSGYVLIKTAEFMRSSKISQKKKNHRQNFRVIPHIKFPAEETVSTKEVRRNDQR